MEGRPPKLPTSIISSKPLVSVKMNQHVKLQAEDHFHLSRSGCAKVYLVELLIYQNPREDTVYFSSKDSLHTYTPAPMHTQLCYDPLMSCLLSKNVERSAKQALGILLGA